MGISSKLILKIMKQTSFPTGLYATGCVDFMSGRSKDGVLLRIFYPTPLINKENTTRWMKWYLDDEYMKFFSLFPLSPEFESTSFTHNAKKLLVPVVWEGTVDEGKFPVVIFSHGLTGNRNIYSTTCADIASYGFIVAAVEHRDGSACSTFTISNSGKKVWLPHKFLPPNTKYYPLRNEQVNIRLKECLKTLDVLELLNQSDARNELPSDFNFASFYNKMDLSSPVIMGHSFGAATTLLTLMKDKRFKLGIALDPWMFPLKEDLEQLKNITQPYLIVVTEGFIKYDERNSRSLRKMVDGRKNIVLMRGAVHNHQSDMPIAVSKAFERIFNENATLEATVAMRLNNTIITAYLCRAFGIQNMGSKTEESFIKDSIRLGLPAAECTSDEFEKVTGVILERENLSKL